MIGTGVILLAGSLIADLIIRRRFGDYSKLLAATPAAAIVGIVLIFSGAIQLDMERKAERETFKSDCTGTLHKVDDRWACITGDFDIQYHGGS